MATRFTGGRPATMTRSAVAQGRTQQQRQTPVPVAVPMGGEADGWVNVDHHKRKHKPTEADGGGLRRTASQDDMSAAAAPKEEPPVPPPNARADALSAAVTMDKKTRERSYYATSPPANAALAATQWGSPLHRSKAASPTGTTMQLERASSLQKLMESWQTVEAQHATKEQQPRNGTRARTRNEPKGDSHEGAVPPPSSASLRRAQSEAGATQSGSPAHRMKSPTGGVRLPTDTKANGSGNTGGGNGSSNNNNNSGNGNGNSNGNASSSSGAAKKCGDKRDFFFRNLDYDTRSLLQIDDVASFSVTDFEMARKISVAVAELFPPLKQALEEQAAAEGSENKHFVPTRKLPLIITDATACVGGNVLSFCDFFQFVYAVEYDATRVSMLENNLRVLKKSNVSCRCASYLDVMYDYEQDVVFIDPPWGGPEYKEQDKVDLFLGDSPLADVCEKLKHRAKFVVLKVPTNFDDEKFAASVSGNVTVRKDFKKMHLIVLDFRALRRSHSHRQ